MAETHEKLLKVVKDLPSDFVPYGNRSRDEDWGPDCSCGCKHFIPLAGKLGMDWGVCANPASPRAGLLTFEHQAAKNLRMTKSLMPKQRMITTSEEKKLMNRLGRTDEAVTKLKSKTALAKRDHRLDLADTVCQIQASCCVVLSDERLIAAELEKTRRVLETHAAIRVKA